MSRIDKFFGAVDRVASSKRERLVTLATIDTAYVESNTARVIFDGETVLSTKDYRVIGTVTADSRAVMLRIGKTWVVVGNLRSDSSSMGVPVGGIIEWPIGAIPVGFLKADGAIVSRTIYKALFLKYGTTFGAGDGSTTFGLPSRNGRVVVGQDPAQVEFDTLGEVGGAKTHVLTDAQMPSHTHIQNSHIHTVRLFAGPATGAHIQTSAGAEGTVGQTSEIAFPVNASTAVNQVTGSDAAHNNLGPYVVSNFIIKY